MNNKQRVQSQMIAEPQRCDEMKKKKVKIKLKRVDGQQ